MSAVDATAKRLPEAFLRALGLSDLRRNGPSAVRIPYTEVHQHGHPIDDVRRRERRSEAACGVQRDLSRIEDEGGPIGPLLWFPP